MILYTVSPLYLWFLHPQIQPTTDQKYLKKNSRKFQKAKWVLLCAGHCVHSISIVLGIRSNLEMIQSIQSMHEVIYKHCTVWAFIDFVICGITPSGYKRTVRHKNLTKSVMSNNTDLLLLDESYLFPSQLQRNLHSIQAPLPTSGFHTPLSMHCPDQEVVSCKTVTPT